jgi:uncharacterized protein
LQVAEPLSIKVRDAAVSGLLLRPPDSWCCLVLAHGAGAGMQHPFMTAVAEECGSLGIATLRYQFPYMEKGGKRPDPPALCQAAVRSAVAAAAKEMPGLPLFAGGKSFGGRMTSQAQAASPLQHVSGLVFLGFPLHPPGEPSALRAEHLDNVAIPMLFLQGTRDDYALPTLLLPQIERLHGRASLQAVEGADHSFHVPARSRRTDAQVRAGLCQAAASWMKSVVAPAA